MDRTFKDLIQSLKEMSKDNQLTLTDVEKFTTNWEQLYERNEKNLEKIQVKEVGGVMDLSIESGIQYKSEHIITFESPKDKELYLKYNKN